MIDWTKVSGFVASEFPEDPNKYAEPALLYALSDLKVLLNERIFPSPASGALARLGGSTTSQHYAVNRKSTACDIFCESIPKKAYETILKVELFKGVGIYLDTKGPDGHPWVMFHVDIRKIGREGKPLIWVCRKELNPKTNTKKDVYHYPTTNEKLQDLLNVPNFLKNKLLGIA